MGCEVDPGFVHRVGEGVWCGVADEAAACVRGVEDEGDVESVCGAVMGCSPCEFVNVAAAWVAQRSASAR